ncbi:MAG: AzlC family ABC transporter permease [Gammaproteobacteria bacterium]
MLKDFFAGGKTAAPIIVVYLILGFAAGVLGASRGLSAAEILLLSLLLFAGSAQFVFPELYRGAAAETVSAVFFINLRHLLYSTALAQQARNLPPKTRAAIGAQLTDETFLLATAKLKGKMLSGGAWMLGLNMASYLAWAAGNVSGALFGGAADLSVVGIQFAGAAMFLALLFPQITSHARPHSAAAVSFIGGGGAALGLWLFPGPATVTLAAAAAALLGVFVFGANESDRQFAAELRERKT